MADLNGRLNDAKDKVEGKSKETVGKVTNDKDKEAEGKLQSGFADVKKKARDAGEDIKDGAEKLGDKIKDGFGDVKDKFHKEKE